MREFYVYILKCTDDSYYTGITNDLIRRLAEHEEGVNKDCYTFKRRPVALVFWEKFYDVNRAIAFEKQIKGWSRKKKETLINSDWSKLKELAKCKNKSSHIFHQKGEKAGKAN